MKKLSIIIVTFNASDDLGRTLQSVFEQTYTNYEVVIIDGESTDTTLEIIQTYEEKIDYWVSEKDSGIYAAMNKGIKVAKGEYLQFLNAGDYFVDHHVLERIFNSTAQFLRRFRKTLAPGLDPTVALKPPTLIYGDINVLYTNGRARQLVAGDFTLQKLLEQGTSVLCHQAMFIRRESAPFYQTRYQFKGELNWYFDIVDLDGFCFEKRDLTVVNYALGGWGHKHFVRNRIDWLRVIYDRYGLTVLWECKIIAFLWHNSFYRYPWLGKVHGAVVSRMKALKKYF